MTSATLPSTMLKNNGALKGTDAYRMLKEGAGE